MEFNYNFFLPPPTLTGFIINNRGSTTVEYKLFIIVLIKTLFSEQMFIVNGQDKLDAKWISDENSTSCQVLFTINL